jgi:hypothetical protein
MKTVFILLILLIQQKALQAKNYVTIAPDGCTNCMAAIDLMNKNNNIYVFHEAYQIDSTSFRHKFTFLHHATIIFSDSLYQLYSVNGQMAVSNKQGTLKCPLEKYGRKANSYFLKWNSGQDVDTISYSWPLAKFSIKKRVYMPEGKVYLLDGSKNTVFVYDFFEDKIRDTVSIPEQAKKDSYYLFSGHDSNIYEYYKKMITPKIQGFLCTIKNITLDGDTLYLYVSNYFTFFSGTHEEDTVLGHFQSILTFYRGRYLASYVPTNIEERLIDTSKKFFAELDALYKYKGLFYTTIGNSLYFKGRDKYDVGVFNPKDQSLDWMVKLSGDMNKSYDYSNPLFNKHYCLIAKSTKLYDLEKKGSYIDLGYFKQKFYNKGPFTIPQYVNFDFAVNQHVCTVLYNLESENKPYYTQVNFKTQKVVVNKYLPQLNPKLVRTLDPYNSDYVIQYADNYKIIRYKVVP